jgi:hypothetical protein
VATIPSVPTEVPGNFNTSALWNANILGGLNYLFAPVRFKGYASTGQSFTSTTTSAVLTLDTEIVDSDGGHSTTTNTSRYTAQTAGLYIVTGSVCFASNATGTRTLQVFLNGVGVTGSAVQSAASGSNGTSVFTATMVQMAVGDYVELAAWQNSGSTLATSTTNAILTTMSLWRISS